MKLGRFFRAALLGAALAVTTWSSAPMTHHGAEAAVAGVDLGGEFFKIALVKPGTPFEIVTNVHSKRKTETMVAFDGDERLYGADAATVGVRRPQTAYAQLRRFLGTTLEDPAIASLIKEEYFPYELLQNETRGTVSLKHEDERLFHAEELVAMVFTHARQITDAFAESSVRDYVVTVPDFFTQAQRQAMLDAAEISGVRVLSLINENTAAALQLAVHTTFAEPRRVLFYNLGSTSLQVSIVEFSSQVVPDGFKKNKTVSGFQVLSKAWDDALGGAKFDLRLAEHLAAEFSEKLGEDVRQIPRPMAKIRAQAKKTKIVLSANEHIPVVMQSLYKDIDFFSSMNRAKFEEMCADLFDRSLKPVEVALERAGLTAADIHEIEIVGGGVRMPKIQQQLKDFFSGKDLGVHLNGDEAMALGAAFHAANLSNSFRVRHVGMTDVPAYPVGVRLVDLDHTSSSADSAEESSEKHWVKRAALFSETSRLGLRKAVSFLHTKDISATFRYDKPSLLPVGASSHIGKYNITGIADFAAKYAEKNLGEPKVTLSFELDGSGIAKIAKAEATLEEEYEVEVEVKKDKKKDSKKKSDKKDDKKDDTDESGEKKDEEEKKEDEEPVEKVKQIKKRTHRATLVVTHAHDTWDKEGSISVLPMSVSAKKDSMRMLREMEVADNKRRANLEAKNRLETFVYTARDTLAAKDDVVQQVTTSDQLEQFNTKLEETEDWLYDEGEKVDAAEYNKKIKSIETDFKAILFRVSEKKDFPEAVNAAKEYAFSTKELMNEWVESKPQVTEEERKDVIEKVEELESWLEESEKKQKATAAHEDPVVTSAEVEKKIQGVKKLVSTLSKKPKPKPAKTEETEEKKSNETTEGSQSESAEDKSEKDEDVKPEETEETVDVHEEL